MAEAMSPENDNSESQYENIENSTKRGRDDDSDHQERPSKRQFEETSETKENSNIDNQEDNTSDYQEEEDNTNDNQQNNNRSEDEGYSGHESDDYSDSSQDHGHHEDEEENSDSEPDHGFGQNLTSRSDEWLQDHARASLSQANEAQERIDNPIVSREERSAATEERDEYMEEYTRTVREVNRRRNNG